MNDASSDALAIVVAMTDPSAPAFAGRLARLSEEAGPLGEVFVVDSSGKLSVEWLARRYSNVRVLYRPMGQLAPQLWREGLLRTEAPLIAFTTASMMLHPGWRTTLLERLRETDASGVGGPIQPARNLSTIDRAVALLRYSGYFPPLPITLSIDPPGDNALYRRDRLREVEHSWADGFWEVEVHQALRKRGQTLAMARSAIATFEGGSTWLATARQRFLHAKHYGADRSTRFGALARLLRVVAVPLVPPLLTGRILRNLRSRKMSLFPWITAGPALLVLALIWAFGEAVGTWKGLPVPLEAPGPRRMDPHR